MFIYIGGLSESALVLILEYDWRLLLSLWLIIHSFQVINSICYGRLMCSTFVGELAGLLIAVMVSNSVSSVAM